jgi:GT2 family glycosyltransferase
MQFTVAVVTHDRPSCVDRLLERLRTQTLHPEEVIVVNNGPNDCTTAVVREHDGSYNDAGIDLRLYERDDINLPAGRNVALEATTGDVICFLDDDTVPAESWLEGISWGYERDDVSGVGGPSIAVDRTLTPRDELETDARNLNRLDRYGEVQDASRNWIPPYPVVTDLLQGSNMSFEKKTLESIGGFDPGYHGYPLFEDTDVMAKYKKRGETLVYHPDALVYHERVARDDSTQYWYWYWYARNSIRFRRQNFSETYYRSLLRTFVRKRYYPPSVLEQIVVALARRDQRSVTRLRGYVRGCTDELS